MGGGDNVDVVGVSSGVGRDGGAGRGVAVPGSLKISNVHSIYLTHLGFDTVGGLPGFVLTKADSFASKKGGGGGSGGGIITNNNYGGTRIIDNNTYNNNESFIPQQLPVLPPIGLKVMGPIGTKQFFQAIRHFVRRDHFRIQVIENSNNDKDTKNTPLKRKRDDINTTIIPTTTNNSTTNVTSFSNITTNSNITSINNNNQHPEKQLHEKKDKKTQKVQESMDYFRIQPLRFTRFIRGPIMCRRPHHDDDSSNSTKSNSIEKHDVTSYIFRTPSIPRRFVLAKAKALGVPPGPLYAQLKAGKTVKFWNNGDARNISFLEDKKSGGKKGGKKKKKKFKKMKGNNNDSINNNSQIDNTNTTNTTNNNNKLITVKPREVLEDCNDTRGLNGLAVIVVYCPDDTVFQQIQASDDIGVFRRSTMDKNNTVTERSNNKDNNGENDIN